MAFGDQIRFLLWWRWCLFNFWYDPFYISSFVKTLAWTFKVYCCKTSSQLVFLPQFFLVLPTSLIHPRLKHRCKAPWLPLLHRNEWLHLFAPSTLCTSLSPESCDNRSFRLYLGVPSYWYPVKFTTNSCSILRVTSDAHSPVMVTECIGAKVPAQ